METILKKCIQRDSLPVDNQLHSDLLSIVNKKKSLSEGNDNFQRFKELFWKQQEQAFSKKNPRSIRWHPLVIKWCLYLHHKSSGA